MHHIRLSVLAAVAAALIASPSFGDGGAGPPKRSAFASVDNVEIGYGPSAVSILAVSLKKGKPHRVLTVDAMLSIYQAAGPAKLLMVPLVNGVPLNPVGGAAAEICTTGEQCSATGVWWLDLDAAESAHPGLIIGQPLTISIVGNDSAQTGSVGSMVLRARLEQE